jgi:hypothetical protein
MSKYKTVSATESHLQFILSECVKLGEAMQELVDLMDETPIDDWTDADLQSHEKIQKAISLGVESEEYFRHFVNMRK